MLSQDQISLNIRLTFQMLLKFSIIVEKLSIYLECNLLFL